jgi:ribonuclease R
MLPEILSNGLCSLKPQVDRLAMVCEMHISNLGEIKQADFYDAVIHSKARLTYTRVAAFLSGGEHDIPESLIPALTTLHKLYERLRVQREERGAIDFETIETQIIFNNEKKIEKIVPRERNEAHKLIEECMLAANESVAMFLLHEKVPILYRVHDQPSPEKIADLREFLKPLGLQLAGDDNPQPKHYAKLLTTIRTREDKHLLQMVLLRSLSQATYSPDNAGHFGLAYEAYTHFTSPIRRYPDLLVHRAIKAILDHHIDPKQFTDKIMTEAGLHCSMTERRADDATRDVTAWLKCEYMQDNVGGEFLGFITGITGFGFFVELKDIYVEGLVHVSSLNNDYYQHDATHHTLIGERTGVIYSVSDQVKVKVASVNLDDRKIDFTMVEQISSQKRTLGDRHTREEKATKKPKEPKAGAKRRRTSSKRKKS